MFSLLFSASVFKSVCYCCTKLPGKQKIHQLWLPFGGFSHVPPKLATYCFTRSMELDKNFSKQPPETSGISSYFEKFLSHSIDLVKQYVASFGGTLWNEIAYYFRYVFFARQNRTAIGRRKVKDDWGRFNLLF